MHQIKSKIIPFQILCFFYAITIVGYAQENTRYSAEVEEKIRRVERSLGEKIKTDDVAKVLEERMKDYKIPGVSIAVIKDYKLEWARGYGFADKSHKIPVTSKTLFQAASTSKSLNAVGVLKLVQNNKADLDSNINSYLTSWKFPYDTSNGKKRITIRNLLSHTAGINIHGFPGYLPNEAIPNIIQILNGSSPANNCPIRSILDAGTQSKYSGGGTTILQMIVMDITKKPYDEFMQSDVLNVLDMNYSFYTIPPPSQRTELLATGYKDDGNEVYGKYRIHPELAAASLWTNPTELSNFIIEMQLAYINSSQKILSREMVSTMFTPVKDDFALGVVIKNVGNDRYFSHSGGNEGFRSKYFGSVEGGNGVVVMVNSNNGLIIDEIINSVATIYEWKDFYKPVIHKVVNVPDKVLDTYVGEYELNPYFKIHMRRDGHTLKSQGTGQSEFDLFPEEQNTFFSKEDDIKVEFVKDANDKIYKIIIRQFGDTSVAIKLK